jgi:hypothetical protein
LSGMRSGMLALATLELASAATSASKNACEQHG